MCYSARIKSEYEIYVRQWGADVSFEDFTALWLRTRTVQGRPKAPRGMGLAFGQGTTPAERTVYQAFLQSNEADIAEQRQALDVQAARLAAAQLKLASARPTKKAADDQRIATSKILGIERRLADLQRTEVLPGDSRIFPGYYVPVMIAEQARRVVKPMRYRCRPYYVEAGFDTDRPGTYNARMDSLEGFWRPLFGHYHAVVIVDAFYEHVERDGKHQVLEFRPQDGEPMLVACLYSPWERGQEELLSFAMITDEPAPEVRAAGHDRLIVRIQPDDVEAWLNPDPGNLQALYDIFERRPRPFYEHRVDEASEP